jgi:hypothetical protein
LARVKGFNKDVSDCSNVLGKVVDEILIFGVDKSYFSTVQKRDENVLGKKGQHQISAVFSGVRTVSTAALLC